MSEYVIEDVAWAMFDGKDRHRIDQAEVVIRRLREAGYVIVPERPARQKG